MELDLSHFQARYLESCKRLEVLPNFTILSSISKAKLQKSHSELCSLEIFLDRLKDSDFSPLIDVLSEIDSFEIDAIDIFHESPTFLSNGGQLMSFIRAAKQKLRIVDLHDLSLGKVFLRDLSQRGMTCQVLNLRSSRIRKLNFSGSFMQLHTLNLDFSISLTSFQEGCFNCMPSLIRLSLCETRVSNLWTTIAALSKLPSLQELRFQNCLCCNDTGPCSTSSGMKEEYFQNEKIGLGKLPFRPHVAPSASNAGLIFHHFQYPGSDDTFVDLFSDDESLGNHGHLHSTSDESSDESEQDVPGHRQGILGELLSNSLSFTRQTYPENLVNSIGQDTSEMGTFDDLNGFVAPNEFYTDAGEEGCSTDEANSWHTVGPSVVGTRKYFSHHPSPICFEKHYREYMIAALPRLEVLDNLPVRNAEKENAKMVFSQYYEYLPYDRQFKESIVSILQKREMGPTTGFRKSTRMKSYTSEKSQHSFRRSMAAAKVGSSAWPLLHPLSKFKSISRDVIKSFRPRQFEYHPSNPSLMVFGTLDGELVVINPESGKLVGYLPSVGALHSVLGLCWLKGYQSKLIAGSDNGSLHLYDICQMPSRVTDRYCTRDASLCTFDDFEQLTSVHANSTDELFITSGYSKHVALYDIVTGRRIQVFKELHREHINVVKFAHHSPSIFATSSFDQAIKMWDLRQGTSRPCYTAYSSRGNVMVCFSPDDHYLLSSAVDNEVKQLLAVDGRVHTKFNIAPTGSAQNYTRSYYLNGKDYVISGSCEESVVRICCAQSGRRFRDVSLEAKGSRNSMFIQSLRGDPFRDFHMSILAAYLRPSSKSEIIKVNLLASSDDYLKDNYYGQHGHPSFSMGG